MPAKYILDKTIDVDTTYQAESDKAYVIRKVGTDSTTKATLSVAGVNCLEIIQNIARISPSHLELIDVVDLADLFVVVPPDKKFGFTGESGKRMRIVGEILDLAPREPLGSNLLARYGEQGKRYLTYQTGSFSKGEDTEWPADEENAVVTFVSPAGERHKFKRALYADIANLAAAHSPGDWSLRFYVQDAPLDILATAMGDLGIDLWNMHYIYDTDEYHKLFSIEDMPIEIGPGRKLGIKARNVSGEAKSPGSGTSITVTVYILDEIELLS
jgi:hypothetical protein